jgi:hypothetical protein
VKEIRGPERLPTETLEKRGSWLAPKRKAEEREVPQRPPREVPPLQDEGDLDRIIRLIPGYDPFHKAEAYEFDRKQAASAIDFIQRYLSHVKGEKAGTAFILEDWEKAIVANLFGWKDKKTGFRRYREAFIEVARKNGKTPLVFCTCFFGTTSPERRYMGRLRSTSRPLWSSLMRGGCGIKTRS